MKRLLANRNAMLTGCVFLIVILFLWLDEIFDLPALLFGAPATPVNITESIFETSVIAVIATLVMSLITLLDKKIERLNQEKSKIISIISHDLKNVFASLICNSKLLNTKKDKLTPEAFKELSASIYSSSKRIVALMDNLLHWSKLNAGLIKINPVEFNLAEIVQNAISILCTQSRDKNISLSHSIEPHISVFADKNLIESVINNLIHNAVKFTPHGGKITVQAIVENNHVKTVVTDTGIGLSKQELVEIMNLKPNNTRRGTDGEKGSGLGLYICQEFIRKNHGNFYIESQLGKGTTISFTLPTKKS